ncbi:MAG TPA: ABC transporter permease [Microbacteriaceae bacterium]|nr:ABC transporter permease [Microbacteriaceae bacterium]
MSFSVIWLVAKRELKSRLFAKATIISAIIFVVLIAGGVQVAAYFLNSTTDSSTAIGVSSEAEPLAQIMEQERQQTATGGDHELIYHTMSEVDAKEDLKNGDIEVYIAGTPSAPIFMFDGNPDGELVALGARAAEQYTLFTAIDNAGADSAQIQQELANIDVEILDINPVTSARQFDALKIVSSLVTIFLLFFALLQSASLIIVGVIEEKVSRVVEILLATIRPAELLAGKVLGIGLMALIQVLLFASAGVLSALSAGLFSLSDINIGVSVLSLLGWFLLGFTIYISLFGGLASLVSRQEDSGAVTTPLIFGMMIPFYLAIYLIPNAPDSIATKILSQIPFFAPFMMPVRVGFDAVETWEVVLSVAISVITVPLVIWIGGRVYSRAVLHTGGRLKLKDALRG